MVTSAFDIEGFIEAHRAAGATAEGERAVRELVAEAVSPRARLTIEGR